MVWANTIGVVLVALALGYWLGGRYADRNPRMRPLCVVVLAAAVLIAAVPFAARPFLGFSVDAFDSVSVGGFAGSLFGVLVLVAAPVTLLGAAAPWAVRLAVADPRRSGEVVGRLYAISTTGSLFGTMIAALLLIPLLGTQRTFLVFALALALVAAAGLGWRSAAVPVLLALAIALPAGTIKAAETGRVLYETETVQQYARVVERDDGSRVLELNEGQAVHSLYRPGSYLTGDYWDGQPRAPVRLHGEAATTHRDPRQRRRHRRPRLRPLLPGTAVDAVEIDGELTELGRRYFDLRNRRMRTYAEDARPWLEGSEGGFDAIMVDAYRQPYIPFYLTTREFFELVGERLAPGGVVIVNVGHPQDSDRLERVLGATMATAFPRSCFAIRSSRPTHFSSAAARGSPPRACPDGPGPCPPGCARPRCNPPAGSRRDWTAERSSATTARRSSGWSTAPCWSTRMTTRARAWIVTGPLGRGVAFAIDFAVAVAGDSRRRGPVGPDPNRSIGSHDADEGQRAARLPGRGRGRGARRRRRERRQPSGPQPRPRDAASRLSQGQGAALAGDPATRVRAGPRGGDPRLAAGVVRTCAARLGRDSGRRPSVELVSTPEQEGEPLGFKFEIGVRPKAELGEYKGLEVGRAEPDVPEDIVDREVDRIRESFAKLETVERSAAEGDALLIDFEGCSRARHSRVARRPTTCSSSAAAV